MLGGDPTLSGGRGGESIFGEFFPDEIPRTQTGEAVLRHSTAGVVSMSNLGTPHTSASQFFITLNAVSTALGRDASCPPRAVDSLVLARLAIPSQMDTPPFRRTHVHYPRRKMPFSRVNFCLI